MAFLGVQLIITLVMLSILQRFSIHYSFARWLLSKRLVRYLHPKNEHLRTSAGITSDTLVKNHGNARKRKKEEPVKEDANSFKVPKNVDITLEATRVHENDLLELQYYPDYQWLVDFAFYSVIVYFMTETYQYFVPKHDEFNLSIIWCLMVLTFSLKVLSTLTAMYFRGGDESMGERSMCLVSGCFFFLLAMIVLILSEDILEFGLDDAYRSFNSTTYSIMETHGLGDSATGPASKLILKFCLAIFSALIGAIFIFPGLRYAQMHIDTLDYSQGKPGMQIILQLSFISPLFIMLSWVKPIARNYLTERSFTNRGTIMTSSSFETSRILLIISVIILKFILMPKYLQAYLNLAPRRLSRLKKEAGKINNTDLQKIVAHVFYYLCVVSLQYVAPLLTSLFVALLLKTMGAYKWTSYILKYPVLVPQPEISIQPEFSMESLKAIFNPIVFRGILSYTSWWVATVWFTSSLVGYVYHNNLSSLN